MSTIIFIAAAVIVWRSRKVIFGIITGGCGVLCGVGMIIFILLLISACFH